MEVMSGGFGISRDISGTFLPALWNSLESALLWVSARDAWGFISNEAWCANSCLPPCEHTKNCIMYDRVMFFPKGINHTHVLVRDANLMSKSMSMSTSMSAILSDRTTTRRTRGTR